MSPNYLRYMAGMLVILIAILACVLPGQTVQPAPVSNPVNIETAVAGTAQAAAQQTQQSNPVPATATTVSTEIPTATPKVSVSGTSLIMREDQSTLFIDYKVGLQLVIPSGWMAVRIGEDEYLKAFSSDVVLQNPAILDRLTIMRDVNTDEFRLEAFDLHPGHMHDGINTHISVIFQPGDTRSLEEWEQAERKSGHKIFTGRKFISASYPQTINGTRVLVIEMSFDAQDNVNTIYYRGVFFALPSGTYVLDFYTNFSYKEERLLEFDQVVNNVTPPNP